MSDMLKHLVMCYKYGLKQLYYFNTYDGAGEVDVDKMVAKNVISEPEIEVQDDEACDSCVL
jgi:hypothetical protein